MRVYRNAPNIVKLGSDLSPRENPIWGTLTEPSERFKDRSIPLPVSKRTNTVRFAILQKHRDRINDSKLSPLIDVARPN